MEIIFEGGKNCERREGGELQQNKEWKWEVCIGRRTKCESSGRSILKICIIKTLMKRLQSTCVALMGYGEVTNSEESQLEELRLR